MINREDYFSYFNQKLKYQVILDFKDFFMVSRISENCFWLPLMMSVHAAILISHFPYEIIIRTIL